MARQNRFPGSHQLMDERCDMVEPVPD